jgi:hypothetical protein
MQLRDISSKTNQEVSKPLVVEGMQDNIPHLSSCIYKCKHWR